MVRTPGHPGEPPEFAHNTSEAGSLRYSIFYESVRGILQSIGRDDFDNPAWKSIVDIYLSEMNPKLEALLSSTRQSTREALQGARTPDEEIDLIRVIAETIIIPECERMQLETELEKKRKIDEQTREVEDITTFIASRRSPDQVIRKIESAFGPIKILIASEDNGAVILKNRIKTPHLEEPGSLGEQNIEYTTKVGVFGRGRAYKVCLIFDDSPALTDHHIQHIIRPMLDYFIEQRELQLLNYAHGYMQEIAAYERSTKMLGIQNDYHTFVSRVVDQCIGPMEYHESGEEKDWYIDVVTRAIDICRSLTSGSVGILEEIDFILEGQMNREVLDKAKHMLMSRDEIPSGLGYPSGLRSNETPIEGKIYRIIRAYEALSAAVSTQHAQDELQEWQEQGAFFDNGILAIFLECLDTDGKIDPLKQKKQQNQTKGNEGQKYRQSRYYLPFIKQWSEVTSLMEEIKEIYKNARRTEDKKTRDDLLKKGDKLQKSLHKAADMTTTILLSRHGETESDVTGTPSEKDRDYELLTFNGEKGSEKKGYKFNGELFDVYTGPLPRAKQTASIICHTTRNCVQDITPIQKSPFDPYSIVSCETCPAMRIEEPLSNPLKGMEGRGLSLWNRVLTDSDSIRLLGDFVLKLIVSPGEGTNLIITHGDTAVYIIFCIRTLFERDEIKVEKKLIKNDTIYTYTIRGGRLLEGKEKETDGLLFPPMERNILLNTINILALEIFGESFFDPGKRTRQKSLHNRFLDFIDRKREVDPEKLSLFLLRLGENPLTASMIPIIEQNISFA